MGFWTNRRVAVTGGGGFIGSHVVELLVEQGAVVSVVDRASSRALSNLERVLDRITVVLAELLDARECIRALAGAEIVLHLAARVAGIAYTRRIPRRCFATLSSCR